ncbi:MAG TPA: hypothetical protein VF916_02105 [Ktedonobacterales bacterium]
MPRFPILTRDQARSRALYDEDHAEATSLFDDAELGITPDADDFRLSDADWREQYARAMLAELVGKQTAKRASPTVGLARRPFECSVEEHPHHDRTNP